MYIEAEEERGEGEGRGVGGEEGREREERGGDEEDR